MEAIFSGYVDSIVCCTMLKTPIDFPWTFPWNAYGDLEEMKVAFYGPFKHCTIRFSILQQLFSIIYFGYKYVLRFWQQKGNASNRERRKWQFGVLIYHTATGTLRDSNILSSSSNCMDFLSRPILTYSSNRSFKSSGRYVELFQPRMSLAALGSA